MSFADELRSMSNDNTIIDKKRWNNHDIPSMIWRVRHECESAARNGTRELSGILCPDNDCGYSFYHCKNREGAVEIMKKDTLCRDVTHFIVNQYNVDSDGLRWIEESFKQNLQELGLRIHTLEWTKGEVIHYKYYPRLFSLKKNYKIFETRTNEYGWDLFFHISW